MDPYSEQRLSRDSEKVIAVGASGGQGLQDLLDLLRELPPGLNASILVTLHRPVGVQSALRDVLQRRAALPVVIARAGEVLEPGVCYIGQPDQHIVLNADRRARLLSDPDHRLRNRTIDALFLSVAEHAGPSGAGVVLSGSLSDGSAGAAAIRQSGGLVMARTPCETALSDMPRNAIRFVGALDLVDVVVGLAAGLEAFVGTLPATSWGRIRGDKPSLKLARSEGTNAGANRSP